MSNTTSKLQDTETGELPSITVNEVPINASGHSEQLERNYGLLSMTSLAICSGSTWVTFGGAITVAIYDGGPAGVLYEFIAVSICYWFVAASIAELASAMPSAGGVYHWASVTAGRYGRINGFFAGWINFFAWIFALASVFQIMSAQVVSMYAIYHPAYTTERWHVFIVYIILTWLTCTVVLFANKALPILEHVGGASVVLCVFITIIICVAMPHSTGDGYASSSAVWEAWDNESGYSSDGLAFCLGMLNGAYCVGTPDLTSHMAEEIPNPSRNIPQAMLMQYVVGFMTGLLYGIALFYSITDLDSVLESSYLFPLTEIYHQTTRSASGTFGLLLLAFLPSPFVVLGCYLTASRVLWTLARDGATPFSKQFAQVSPRFKNPFNAILACGVTCTLLGCIYVGSLTAFNAFVGSFVILTTLSYFLAIFPHLISNRKRITPGQFWMSAGIGHFVNTVSCVYILAFVILFCFPFSLPVDAANMNYASLITGGLTLLVAVFWFWCRHDFKGPQYVPPGSGALAKEAI